MIKKIKKLCVIELHLKYCTATIGKRDGQGYNLYIVLKDENGTNTNSS